MGRWCGFGPALAALVLSWLGGTTALGNQRLGHQSRRPNVLFIYLDDANTDMGTYGHPVVRTPHIDRLAKRGVRFDRAYCPDPVCTPSRVSLLTGMRPTRTGYLHNSDPPFIGPALNGSPTLPFKFHSEGYFVGGAGKIFHNLFHDPASWDEYQALPDDWWIEKPDDPVPGDQWKVIYWGPFMNGPGGSLGKMRDTKHTDAILRMMTDHRDDPFFLAIGYMAPHSPFIYPQAYSSLYDPAVDVPPLPPEENSDAWKSGLHPRMYRSETYLDPAWENDPEGGRRECTVAYWRTITYVDHEIGRLLRGLDRLELTDRTIVVLVSDHGFSFGYHDRFYKDALFDQSARTPMILSVPGRPELQGTFCSRPVEHIDIYPTLMELCSLRPPAGLDGMSLLPVMEHADAPHKPAFITLDSEWGAHIERAVRGDRFKFIYWESGEHVLYDLLRDPGEYQNLYGDPAYSGVVREQMRLLEQYKVLAASWNNYRRGLEGTRGVPTATVSAAPVMGGTAELEFTGSSPNAEAALLVSGLLGTNRLGPGGGRLLVNPLLIKPIALPASRVRVPLTIPSDPRLAGLSMVIQLIQIDRGAPADVSYSRGLRLFFWPR